jgi:hypothetical protein
MQVDRHLLQSHTMSLIPPVMLTPGLDVSFFGPDGAFFYGTIVGIAMLPQVSNDVYMFCIVILKTRVKYRTVENSWLLLSKVGRMVATSSIGSHPLGLWPWWIRSS